MGDDDDDDADNNDDDDGDDDGPGKANLLPNCSEIGPNGQPVFPETAWDYGPPLGNVSCNVAASSVEFPIVCAPGYAPNPYDDVPLACLPECPLPYYSDAQWDALWYLYALFGVLTVVVAIFVPPYFFSPTKWHWPQQMNMWIMFCSTMVRDPPHYYYYYYYYLYFVIIIIILYYIIIIIIIISYYS